VLQLGNKYGHIAEEMPTAIEGYFKAIISHDDCENKQYCVMETEMENTLICYLNRYCRSWTYNRTQFQSAASEFCGQYCVIWCVLNSTKVDLSSLLSSVDTGLNDSIVC